MFARARASSAPPSAARRRARPAPRRTRAGAPDSAAPAPGSSRRPGRPARRGSARRRGRRRPPAARRRTARRPRCPSARRIRGGEPPRCHHAPMQIHFLGGATTVTGSQFLLEHRAGPGPHRLRDVPGQPERIDPQPDPVRVRSGRPRRGAADPRPPRPLRAAAAAGQGRLPRPDPRDGRHDRARRRSSCSTRASSTRSSPSARRAGRSATPTRSRRTTARRPTSTRPPSTGRGTVTSAAGRGADAGAPPRPPTHVGPTPRPSTSTTRAVRTDPPAWPRDPEAELRAQPPHLDIDLDAPLYTAKDAERSLAQFKPVALRRGGRGRAGDPRHVRRRRPHPRLGDHPAARPGRRRRRGADHRLLGRPRPARHADPARPDGR